jgi:hypothetical protein
MTTFFRFVNKRAGYSFGIISLAHAPVNVTDFSIGSIDCNPKNADRGRSIIARLLTKRKKVVMLELKLDVCCIFFSAVH